MTWEKYKWYILGYIFYVSIVLASIWNERRDFWPLFIIWCVTIPIALYVISHFAQKYRKGEESMSIVQFVLYCVLTFIVFGFILSVLFAVIPEFIPRPYKRQLENNPEIMFGIVFILLASYVAFQSYRYSKVAKQTKTPTSIEDVDLGID